MNHNSSPQNIDQILEILEQFGNSSSLTYIHNKMVMLPLIFPDIPHIICVRKGKITMRKAYKIIP